MKTPDVNLDIKINPFMANFQTPTIRRMIEQYQDDIRKKKIPLAKVSKARYDLLELQEILKRRIHGVTKDPTSWKDVEGCEVYISATDQMGTVVRPFDSLTVLVEWGENGQENDYYPEELEIRVPGHIWQMP